MGFYSHSLHFTLFIKMKKQHGQFYTAVNPFHNKVIKWWLDKNIKPSDILLEPFAGSGNLVRMLEEVGFTNSWMQYDIEPAGSNIIQQDTFKNFPTGHRICITNPPYLSKTSAGTSGIPFPPSQFQDLYLHSLDLCLNNCDYVLAIVPCSFTNNDKLKSRLSIVIEITEQLFNDTQTPICIALFNSESTKDYSVYCNDNFIGRFNDMKQGFPPHRNYLWDWNFSDKNGAIGFSSIDDVYSASIYFTKGAAVAGKVLTSSNGAYKRISAPHNLDLDEFLHRLNKNLKYYRKATDDIYLTTYYTLRKDGKYKRRLSNTEARMLLDYTLDKTEPLQINRKLYLGDLGRELEIQHGLGYISPLSLLDDGLITLDGAEYFPIKV